MASLRTWCPRSEPSRCLLTFPRSTGWLSWREALDTGNSLETQTQILTEPASCSPSLEPRQDLLATERSVRQSNLGPSSYGHRGSPNYADYKMPPTRYRPRSGR